MSHLRIPSGGFGWLTILLKSIHIQIHTSISICVVGSIGQTGRFVVLASREFGANSSMGKHFFALLSAVALSQSRVVIIIVLNSHVHPIVNIILPRAAELTVVPDMLALIAHMSHGVPSIARLPDTEARASGSSHNRVSFVVIELV